MPVLLISLDPAVDGGRVDLMSYSGFNYVLASAISFFQQRFDDCESPACHFPICLGYGCEVMASFLGWLRGLLLFYFR